MTDLDGEDQDSTSGHHVEEEDHSFILVGGVGVKDPLGHHVTLRHTQHRTHCFIVITKQMKMKQH